MFPRRLLGLLLAAGTVAPAASVQYHRLRVEYTTTSDWTTLELRNPEGILSLRRMAVAGEPTRVATRVDLLSLNQPLSAAQDGRSVGVTVDYALAAGAAGEPLRFLLKKGSLRGSIVRVLAVEGNETRLIQETSHQRTVPGDSTNPLEFTVDLAPLKDARPVRGGAGAVTPRTVWAFYYPWYRAGDWTSAQLKDRPATRYSSDDPAAIARHIEQAQRAGIDGFISSWWGPGHYTDQNLKLLLEEARQRSFAVTIYFETLTNSGGRPVEQIQDWLIYAITTYRDHPAWFRVNGKPLIVIWASGAVPLASWETIFANLRRRGLDAVYLAMGYDTGNLAVFDGLHEYGVFNIANLAGTAASTGRATRFYPLLADSPAPRIWAATAQPGYDDRLIPGRAGQFQDRQDGAFYRGTFDAALRSDPDLVFLTTWNEWWEHTYIEPSELYGEQYLRITRELADKWKSKAVNAVVNAADFQSGGVAPGEVVTLYGVGLGPEKLATLELDASGRVARELAETRVLFDGVPAPLIYVQAGQISAVVPYAVTGETAIQVEYQGVRSKEITAPVVDAAPAVFPGAILNQDGSVNSAARPAARGSIVTFYATGEGRTDPPGIDGAISGAPLPKPVQAVAVTIGGQAAEVRYAGAAPGLVAGVMQVNARVPEGVAPGAVPLVLKVGEKSGTRVSLAVE